MRKLIAIAVMAAMSLPLPAQQEPVEEIFIETMEVTVVSLDVFVTDRSGKPVPGLTAEDFVVLENGRVREITNFSEIREIGQPLNIPSISPKPLERIPEQRSRKIIFFVDNETLHPFNRNRVFDQIRGFTGEMLRPGDQAMLVTWNRGLKVEIPFTSLISEFQRTLVRVAGENTGRSERLMRRRQAERQVRNELEIARDPKLGVSLADAYQNSLSIARSYAEEARNEMRAKTVALTGLMSTLAGVEGKKAFIYVGEDLPMQPGLELFNYVNEYFEPESSIQRSQGGLPIQIQPAETQIPPESLSLDAISRAANANGVTIYMMNAGGAVNVSETPAEVGDPRSIEAQFNDMSNRVSAFQMVADKTGGLAFTQTTNMEGAFDAIESDFGTYYSLGYHQSPDSPLGEKRIRVELKNPGYEVRTRRSFVTKSTNDQIVDGVIANLFYETGQGDLPIRVEAGTPTKVRRGNYRVTMRVMIPTEALTLIPIGERLAGKFSVYLGVGDGKGGMSQIYSQEQPVNVPLAELQQMVGKHFTFETDLVMRKGENILAVAVLDNVSNMKGYGRTRLDVK